MMTTRSLALLAIYYLYLPLAIFLCSWVQLWVGLPLTILLGAAPIFLFKNLDGRIVTGTRKKEIIIFGVLLLWVILSGMGGYVWQNRWDHFFRNAIFNDLVLRSWPVIEGVDVLTYYIGFWLPAALAGKISGSLEVGYFVQLVYGFVGILLAFRLTIEKIGNLKLRYLLPFILFSGVDILYFILFSEPVNKNFHIELWSGLAFWESNTTLINWVYNQAIPSWVATMLILNYGKMQGVGAITLCFLFLSAPFSVVGLFPLVVYYILSEAFKRKAWKRKIIVILNPLNFLALLGAIPVAVYFRLNTSTDIVFGLGGYGIVEWICDLVVLLILELLIYLPFIYKQIKGNPEFYILLGTCVLCLFVQMKGHYGDFNARVELPLNFYMTLQVSIFIGKWNEISKLIKRLFLTVSIFAVVTPTLETARVVYMTLRSPKPEYRSVRFTSIFETEVLRQNFIADSVLTSDKTLPGISLLRYNKE